LITTPASYYSTPKGRYLGARYKENLDRLVEKIVRNPKTASLQFANNIAGLGGIGFFTHSETKTSDERYLEVIIGTPETLESSAEVSAKIAQLFTRYGSELLSILASDSEIFLEKEVSGYGLNFAWRTVIQGPAATRVAMERAVVYFPKEKVKTFLKKEVDQNAFLADAVMFTALEDGPMNVVSFRAPVANRDSRPPIVEETLARAKETSLPALAEAPSKEIESSATLSKPAEAIRRPTASEKPPTRAPEPLPGKPKNAVEGARQPAIDPNQPETSPAAPPRASGQTADVVKKHGKEALQQDRVPKAEMPPDSGRERQITPQVTMEGEKTSDETPGVAKDSGPPSASSMTEQSASLSMEPIASSVAAEKQIERTERLEKVEVTAVTEKADAILPKQEAVVNEQIALLRSKPSESQPAKKAMSRLPSKTLEGFIIQIAFSDKTVAQRWAETLGRRGYAVSLTETAGGELIRLRLGNFAVRNEAERQLRQLRNEGLRGIVVTLPQAYKPEQDFPTSNKSDQNTTITR
jgi:DedD protein